MKILPQNLKVFKMNSVFTRLLLSFTGFILISVLLVGVTSYISSSKRLLEEVKKSNMLILKQSRDSIDKEIARINDISVKIAVDKRVSKASYLSKGAVALDTDVYGEISGYLNMLKSTSNIYSNIWIKFNKSENILNFENKYDEKAFFNEVCVYKSELEWEKLFHGYYAFSSIGRQEIYFNYLSSPVITFIRSIPVGDIDPLGMVVINMDEKVLSSSINTMDKSNPMITYIIDSKNQVIYCNDSQYQYGEDDSILTGMGDIHAVFAGDKEGALNKVINGKDYTVEYTSSNVNDWKYITLIPDSFITAKVSNIRSMTVVIMILSFIVGLVLAYILVKKIYNPVNKIVSYLDIISNNNRRPDKYNKKSGDEFGFINNIINYVYSENETLKESFHRNIPMLKEKVISDLLDGKVSDLNFKDISENIGVELPFRLFQVFAFEIDDYSTISKNLQNKLQSEIIGSLETIASEVLKESARIYPIKKSRDKIIVLFNGEESCQETGAYYEYLNHTVEYFSQNYGITFTIGLGKTYDSYENCSMSFIEALYALKYKVVKGQNTIIHIDEVSSLSQNIFEYPIETEKHLVNKLKSGDMESITKILEDIFARNLNSKASPEMVNNFFNSLVGTLVRTVYEIQTSLEAIFNGESDLYNEISTKNTITEKKNYILYLFETVTSFVNRRKTSHNLKVYETVISFITNNYEKELSLDNVSEVVGLSPSYLSLVFKEVSGVNFVEYVNQYRINQAKALLKDITLTVSEISEKVGYSNSNTFIKVFKKYEGITPGQYREMSKT